MVDSFECKSGVLLWGQLHTIIEGYLSDDYDAPNKIPSPLDGGTIIQRCYNYKAKAKTGTWKVLPILSRYEKTGYVVYINDVDPVSIVRRCSKVGISLQNSHSDDRIVYVNRYDWGCHHRVTKEAENLSEDMFSCRLIVVDGESDLDEIKKSHILNGVHLTIANAEYELGWLVYNKNDQLIAIVYDGAYTVLEAVVQEQDGLHSR